MNRWSFLFIQLLTASFLAGQIQAGSIPILKDIAKKSPQAEARVAASVIEVRAPVTLDTSLQSVVVLGCEGDISDIKERCSGTGFSSAENISPPNSSRSSRKSIHLSGIAKHITSKSVVILDAESGETLFAMAPDNPRQPASTIKVLTGMIAMKRLKENEKVEVSRHAERMPRSKVYLRSGKQYKADDLINAVLLASANDASVALAEKIAGNEDDFAKLMTLHARLWGAENTICRTASGLTAKGQQSTARDLAQIFRRAMQDEEFAERMKRRKIKTSYGKLLRNHNRALWQVEGALAGKTGYTNLARQTYVGQFKRGEDTIVVAIMGSETMWRDIRRLVEYGFKKKEQIRIAQLERKKTEDS